MGWVGVDGWMSERVHVERSEGKTTMTKRCTFVPWGDPGDVVGWVDRGEGSGGAAWGWGRQSCGWWRERKKAL